MMASDQFFGDPLFSAAAFMPSQSTDSSISPSKIRTPQTLIPMTVKQIVEAYHSSEDLSSIVVDGVDLANVKLVGLVMNRVERVTDVSFTLDDGTGRIDISRWANESSDTNEVASIMNGIYVKVHGHMRGFQGKRHALAFSVQYVLHQVISYCACTSAVQSLCSWRLLELVDFAFIFCEMRPLTDFNEVVLHFVECIHVHLEHIRLKGGAARMQMNVNMTTPFSNGIKGYSAPITNQFQANSNMNQLGNDIYNLVLRMFQEPAILAHEHGVHVDELFRRISLPRNKIMDAINHLADLGHIYSTIDEYHFKSANT